MPAVQRQSRPLLPELSELFNGFPTFANLPALASLRPLFDSHLLRLEDEMKEGVYEVRAELPGSTPPTTSRRPADDQGRAHPDERVQRARGVLVRILRADGAAARGRR